ncbi:MAG: L,D-transpeptidase family protein [Halanaerobiaceae bacterium]
MYNSKYKFFNYCVFLCLLSFLLTPCVRAAEPFKGDIYTLLNYIRIHKAVLDYRNIEKQGGWAKLPYDKVLRKGDISNDIALLKKRLYMTGDLNYYHKNNSNIFDDKLYKAVKLFQWRHGLIPDGIAGPTTIKTLNIPVSDKLSQLEMNQSKIYNLFEDYIDSYILVNIPEYRLRVVEDGEEILNMKTIVGKKYSKTPIFHEELEYIVLNPTWRIPIKKVVLEIIPKIKKDPEYLKRKNIKVFDGWDDKAVELSPENIEWDNYSVDNFDLMLEQEAGKNNELGIVKFMFPNDYLVYIHDTPYKELFSYNDRSFSSGCIRVEKPIELAEYCLKENKGWNLEKIMKIIDEEKITKIDLVEHIPVVTVYWTSWVDEDGIVHFRKDIYNSN